MNDATVATNAAAERGIEIISRWIFNCYAVRDGGLGSPVVVDAGIESNAHDAAALTGAGDDAGIVVATHCHTDHIGAAPSLIERTRAELHIPEKARDYVAGEKPRTPDPRAMAKLWPVLLDQRFSGKALKEAGQGMKVAGYASGDFRLPVEPAGYLADGDSLPGAPDWNVIRSPGHTDDSISFYNTATKTLCSGDAIVSCAGRAWFNPEFCDPAQSADTEARMRDLDVELLLPGHGTPLAGRRLLANARSFREHLPDRLAYTCKSFAAQFRRQN